jgi:hypothetical protein
MMRDPRDVLVSYDDRWNKGRRTTEYLTSTAALLKYYLHHLLQHTGSESQILRVRYESLTAHPATELERICTFLGIDFEPTMLEFYRRHANVEQDMADGQHHRMLAKPATADHVGRYRTALSPAQIALVERLLGDEMRAVGYVPEGRTHISFGPGEQKTFAKAERYFQEMVSGDIRMRLRRKGRLKLLAYRVFGRTLGLLPSWRLATTEAEWQQLAQESTGTERVQAPTKGLVQ